MIKEFINNYGYEIIMAVLTAIVGFIGTQLKKIYESKVNDARKKKFAEQAVNAVEQAYDNLKGDEKYFKAMEYLTERLNQEGIYWTELELDILIESCVAELNKVWEKGGSNG